MAYNYCTRCGKRRIDGRICPCRYVAADNSDQGNTFLSFFWGAAGRNGEQYFERDVPIVPQSIDSCGEEVPIRQYHVVNFRSWLKLLWAEGRLMVTNKRIVFRASGRSILGRTVLQQEYKIEEISGFDISKGVRLDVWALLLTIALVIPVIFSIAAAISAKSTFVAVLVACVAMFGYYKLPRRKFIRVVLAAAATGALGGAGFVSWLGDAMTFGSTSSNAESTILTFIAFVCGIIMIVAVIRFSLKESVSLNVACKAGAAYPIKLAAEQHFKLQFARELLPATDTETVIGELGAMIQDIQQIGDFAIEKWKVKDDE